MSFNPANPLTFIEKDVEPIGKHAEHEAIEVNKTSKLFGIQEPVQDGLGNTHDEQGQVQE